MRLPPGVTFEELDAQALSQSDLDAVKAVHMALGELFRNIRGEWDAA